MAKKSTPEFKAATSAPLADQPAATLLKSWSKKIAKGGVPMIPVYIGGNWSLAVPRGNKRILQLALTAKASKS